MLFLRLTYLFLLFLDDDRSNGYDDHDGNHNDDRDRIHNNPSFP